ncbi:hypothetical protein [Curtobacterium sp. VKM Ac-1376]|uniref:hypothetical protein n=1 Tax=Curtobacterium sp. VKM Ac-1376 TaxID=123312 RepID=UPI00188A32F5|nr:hypothetical protein [Curtobacterium sp. VKM Ac-1376]MBF4613083.1 hypothetical protein [Curtobacterium sp. VKM Ac-1376]
MNPLVPTVLDAAVLIVCLVALILALAAFGSLARSASLNGWRLLAWAFVVLFVPFVGPATWFVARRRARLLAFQQVSDDA